MMTRPSRKDVWGVGVLGESGKLLGVVDQLAVTDIIVAILGPMNGSMFQALLDAQQAGVEITRMPVAYEELIGRVPIHYLESDWMLRSFVDEVRASGLYLIGKRIIDISAGLVGVLVFLLTLPWVALAIVIESGRPVFYRQTRLGLGGHPYRILKYRTMTRMPIGWPGARSAQRDPRMTCIGRSRGGSPGRISHPGMSCGEMSLIGAPGTARIADLERRSFYRFRLLVKLDCPDGLGQLRQGIARRLKS
jgi:hypothetical protein